jgi:hypothetical protein
MAKALFERLYLRYPHFRQFPFGWRFPKRSATAVLGLVVVACLIRWGFRESLSATEWASWVQAFGSIGAIMGAWFIGRAQSKSALEQALQLRDREHVERVRALFPIAARAFELVQDLEKEPFDSYYQATYSEGAFRTCLKAIAAIPLHELGSYGLVQGYMEMQQALEAAALAAAGRKELGQFNFAERQRRRAADGDISAAYLDATMALKQIEDHQPSRALLKIVD